jgi:hypothetical protein
VAAISRPQGRALRLLLFVVIDGPIRLQGTTIRAGIRYGRCDAALSVVADRSIRHIVFHRSAAGIFRLHQSDRALASAGDMADWRSARNLSCQYRLDVAGRFRRPSRLLLHRLHPGDADLRAHRACTGAALARLRRASALGPRQRRAGLCPLREIAVHLAAARSNRRSHGGDGSGADGQDRLVQAAALLRARFNRHLSRLLPADGGDAHYPEKERADRRCRDDGGAHHTCWRHWRSGVVLDRARHLGPLPVRAADGVPSGTAQRAVLQPAE